MKNLIPIILLWFIQVTLFAQKPLVNIFPFGEDLVEDSFGEDIYDYTFSISGTLSDHATNEPIIFASVAIFDANSVLICGVETNLKGEYRLQNIKPGWYFLESSYIGYNTLRTSCILIFDYAKTNYDLFLKENKNYPIMDCGGWKVPLFNMANPSYITTFTSNNIKNRY